MHCRYHVAVELVPQRLRRPFLGYSPGYGEGSARLIRARGTRTILKCPVPGCPCVAAMPGDDPGAPAYVVVNEEAFA